MGLVQFCKKLLLESLVIRNFGSLTEGDLGGSLSGVTVTLCIQLMTDVGPVCGDSVGKFVSEGLRRY